MDRKRTAHASEYTTIRLPTGLPSILTDASFYLGVVGQRSKLVELMLRIALAHERADDIATLAGIDLPVGELPLSGLLS